MTKSSRQRQKFKYLENKKSFYNEIKNIFHYFKRAFIELNQIFFFLGGGGGGGGGESRTLSIPLV